MLTYTHVTPVPSVTHVYFFIFLDFRDAGRFVRCGFGYVTFVMVPRTRHVAAHSPCCRASVWPRICGTAHSPCRRAFVCAAHPCCRASMVPRTCMLSRTSVSAHSSFGRALVCRRASLVPRVYVLPRTFVCVRAVLCIAAHSTCCHARPGSSLYLAVFPRISYGAAHRLYVRPRIGPSLPRSSPYFP